MDARLRTISSTAETDRSKRPTTNVNSSGEDIWLSPGRHRRHLAGGRRHVDRLEVSRADDFEILHVRRVVVEIVHDPRPLMHDIAGLYQGRLVLAPEARTP